MRTTAVRVSQVQEVDAHYGSDEWNLKNFPIESAVHANWWPLPSALTLSRRKWIASNANGFRAAEKNGSTVGHEQSP